MENILTCKTCKKKFSTIGNLDRHKKKKFPCYGKIECEKCFKIFKRINDLKKHQKRKTPCEPIQGNPLEKTPENTCHFCYKTLSNKQSLKRHFGTCGIKQGGMALLFKKVTQLVKANEEQCDKIKALEEKVKEKENKVQAPVITGNENIINTYNNSPHNNTTLNFTIQGYDSDKHNGFLKTIIEKAMPGILELPFREDVPMMAQTQDRIQQIMMACYRNPEHKEMQNIYVLDTIDTKENAFIYQEGNWKLRDWEKLSVELIQKIRFHASAIKTKNDILKVTKHIMILAGSDEPTVEKMTEQQIQSLYKDIGEKLKFETIVV